MTKCLKISKHNDQLGSDLAMHVSPSLPPPLLCVCVCVNVYVYVCARVRA